MTDESASSIIIDTGSGFCKAGMSSEEVPKIIFPTIVGRSKIDMGGDSSDFMIGKEALDKKAVLNIIKPIARGYVQDWDALEQLWRYCFHDELKVEVSNHPLLFGMYPNESKVNKERTALIFFEDYNCPGIYGTSHGLLALYGSGKTTGLVIDSGEDVTNVMPIQDGYLINHAYGMIEIGGSDVNEYLLNMLKNKKVILDMEDVRKLKESRLYNATEFSKEMEDFKSGLTKQTNYELPDHTMIELAQEQIQAPEILFKPGLIGRFDPGVHEMTSECLQKLDSDLKRELYSNIILCGGNSMMHNYPNRLNREILTVSPNNAKVKIIANPDRQHLAWNGASVISTLSTFGSMWITQTEYEENGPSIIHRKCL